MLLLSIYVGLMLRGVPEGVTQESEPCREIKMKTPYRFDVFNLDQTSRSLITGSLFLKHLEKNVSWCNTIPVVQGSIIILKLTQSMSFPPRRWVLKIVYLY